MQQRTEVLQDKERFFQVNEILILGQYMASEVYFDKTSCDKVCLNVVIHP